MNQTHAAQRQMIPGYESDYVSDILQGLQKNHLGAKLMGSGV